MGSIKRVPSSSSDDKSLPATDGFGGRTNVSYNCPSGQSPRVDYRFRQNKTAAPDPTITTVTQVLGCVSNVRTGLKWSAGRYYFQVKGSTASQATVSGGLYASN